VLAGEALRVPSKGETPMDWSFGDVIWTMFVLYIWVLLIWMFVSAFTDVFRRDDLSGGGKALWTVVLVFFPFIGPVIYILSRPAGPGQDRRLITGADQPRMPLH
jgi:predicted membrane channel-forming protein YqfA (hemolysin III family)